MLTPQIFSALRRIPEAEPKTVSAGMRQLIATASLAAVDVAGTPWIDVDTAGDRRRISGCGDLRPRSADGDSLSLIEAVLARRSDAVVVNGVAIRNELIRWQRVSRAKVHIIPNIVDFDHRIAVDARSVRATVGGQAPWPPHCGAGL